MHLVGLIVLQFLLAFHAVTSSQYDGYSKWETIEDAGNQIDILNITKNGGLKIVKKEHYNESFITKLYYVSPDLKKVFLQALVTKNITHKLLNENVNERINKLEKDIDKMKLHIKKYKCKRVSTNLYRRYDAIINAYMDLADHIPSSMSYRRIGTTYEGRRIWVFKIAKDTTKPILLIVAGERAREWIGPAALLFFTKKLIMDEFFFQNSSKILDKYQIFIVPVVNPDGYEFSHTNDRMWVKNRRLLPNSKCVGVDINRNFPFKWNHGESNNTCSDMYRGESGGSEEENKAIINLLEFYHGRIEYFISVQAYGQLILLPHGYKKRTYPSNYNKMLRRALDASYAVLRRYRSYYVVGTPPDILYAAGGSSLDYVFNVTGVKLSVCVVLSPRLHMGKENSFTLPATKIDAVGLQLHVIIKTLMK